MLEDYHPVVQALLGTFFTWFLTAAGSALVFVFSSSQRKVLDASLGFAAGVMMAASYWSLLAPAIEMTDSPESYGRLSFIPVSIGFFFGAVFVYFADAALLLMGITDPFHILSEGMSRKSDANYFDQDAHTVDLSVNGDDHHLRRRNTLLNEKQVPVSDKQENKAVSWKRIMLLIAAITIHNIPEGLAVGVGFGAIGRSSTATFQSARNLAIGIGLQNFPEGLAVSLPLRGAGMSVWRSFWFGQLSGMVEPIAGVFGAILVVIMEPLLPYALAFAAGAMIYVVFDDIIPEAHSSGNGKMSSCWAVFGFILMMCLDVGLG